MHAYVFVAAGLASFFTRASSGTTMADGQPLIDSSRVCATRHLVPFGTRLTIINDENRNESWCIVEDYGPSADTGRILDVSLAVAQDLDMVDAGVVRVRIYRQITVPSRRTSCVIQCTVAPLPIACGPLCF